MGGVLSQGTRKADLHFASAYRRTDTCGQRITDKKPGKIDGNGLGG